MYNNCFISYTWEGHEYDKNIREHLEHRGCFKEQIEHISIDMSSSFIAGAMDGFPKANIVFDKFYIIKLFNEVGKLENLLSNT